MLFRSIPNNAIAHALSSDKKRHISVAFPGSAYVAIIVRNFLPSMISSSRDDASRMWIVADFGDL